MIFFPFAKKPAANPDYTVKNVVEGHDGAQIAGRATFSIVCVCEALIVFREFRFQHSPANESRVCVFAFYGNFIRLRRCSLRLFLTVFIASLYLKWPLLGFCFVCGFFWQLFVFEYVNKKEILEIIGDFIFSSLSTMIHNHAGVFRLLPRSIENVNDIFENEAEGK
jgi:hypothetical protein